MPYKFVADSFHAKKLCNRLSSSEVRFYTNHSSSQKTSHFVWYKNLDRFFFSCVTIHAFDKQTDRQTDGRRRTFFSQLYSAVKSSINTTGGSLRVFQ